MLPWRLIWLLFPCLALAELVAHWAFSGSAPDEAEWRALVHTVDRMRGAGDLLVVAPTWAEPLARQVLGEERMPLVDLGRSDVATYSHALEVGLLGQRSEELRGFRSIAEMRAGPFRLRRLANPAPVAVSYRFLDHAAPPALEVFEVFEARPDRELPCAFSDGARSSTGGLPGHVAYPRRRFQCAAGEPFLVGVTLIEDAEYRPRRCLFAHPVQNGVLRLTFADVPLARRIRGHAGQSYLIARDGIGTPVELGAFVDEEPLGTRVFRDDLGYQPFEFAVPRARAGSRGKVRFEVRSADAEQREFCFAAEMQ